MLRLPPIPQENWNDAQRQLAQTIAGGPRGGLRGPFIPLLWNPELTLHLQEVGEHLRFKGILPKTMTELAVLTVAQACRSPYEWQAHVQIARREGLSEEIIEAVGNGRRPDASSPPEALAVYDFAVLLLAKKAVTDPVYEAVVMSFGEAGVIELIGLCGYYALLAMVLNVAETALPDGRTAPFERATAET